MKAVKVYEYGGPEVMKMEEVPVPRPGENSILIKVRAAGVNPVDTYLRSGTNGYTPPLPWTPGFDASGIVEKVGSKVTGFSEGDRVYTTGTISGTYAEKMLAPAAVVFHLPENVGFTEGAGLGVPFFTAYRALKIRGGAEAGETVLVHGASGGVGTAAVQIAATLGLKVIGTASPGSHDMVKEQGADHVLDHHDPDHFKKIMEITDGKGVDVILEMLSNVNLGKDLEILARKGRVVVIGSRGTVEINPRNLMGKDADIRGMSLMNADHEEIKMIAAQINPALVTGKLKPVIRKELPLENAAHAHKLVMEPGARGKIVLIP